MGNGVIGKIIYFWIYMIAVVIFAKIAGVMENTGTAVIVLIAAAIIYIVWNVARYMGKKKREEREEDARQASIKSKGKRR